MKPTIHACGRTIAEAWEDSLLKLNFSGSLYHGRYWAPEMAVGRHATMIIRVEDFAGEPRIHRGFTCEPADLLAYRGEVLDGTDRQWEYTYHDRIFMYGGEDIDQFRYAIRCLQRKPGSHKAVITLADPRLDVYADGSGTHIPCLRNISFELEDIGAGYKLNTYLHWRARDAMHAAFCNLFGFSFLAEKAARILNNSMEKPVSVGGCVDMSDDYHVNGKDMAFLQRIMTMRGKRSIEDRTWHTCELEEMVNG